MNKQPINFDELWKTLGPDFPYSETSWVHGIEHFKNVEKNGAAIAINTNGVDWTVMRLFAIFHDIKRENDYTDPEHGYRAAMYVMQNLQNKVFCLTETQLQQLMFAITFHSLNFITTDLTVGCCWDADRLDFVRFKKQIDVKCLSTDIGKKMAKETNKHMLIQKKKEIDEAIDLLNQDIPLEENNN